MSFIDNLMVIVNEIQDPSQSQTENYKKHAEARKLASILFKNAVTRQVVFQSSGTDASGSPWLQQVN